MDSSNIQGSDLFNFSSNLNVSATIAPNIQNWITANQNRILANKCKIKLRLVDLTLLAESGLTGGHISDFVMKGAFVVDLKGILRVSLYKLVELNKDELAVLLNKIGSFDADNEEQKTELGYLGKKSTD